MEPRPLALQLSLLLADLFARCSPADFIDYASASASAATSASSPAYEHEHSRPFSSTSTSTYRPEQHELQQQHQLDAQSSSSGPSLEGEAARTSGQGGGHVNPVELLITMERALSHFVTCEVISSQEKVRGVVQLCQFVPSEPGDELGGELVPALH